MLFHSYLCLGIFFVWSVDSFASNTKLKYEPSIVELSGTLELQTFPGLPNYESIASGDEPEKGFYLRLDHPIEILSDKNATVDNPENEKNVRIIQLSTSHSNGTWQQVHKAGVGAHVIVVGQLFHRFTGHHHSRILITTDKVR